jgi:hypothetical protein
MGWNTAQISILHMSLTPTHIAQRVEWDVSFPPSNGIWHKALSIFQAVGVGWRKLKAGAANHTIQAGELLLKEEVALPFHPMSRARQCDEGRKSPSRANLGWDPVYGTALYFCCVFSPLSSFLFFFFVFLHISSHHSRYAFYQQHEILLAFWHHFSHHPSLLHSALSFSFIIQTIRQAITMSLSTSNAMAFTAAVGDPREAYPWMASPTLVPRAVAETDQGMFMFFVSA